MTADCMRIRRTLREIFTRAEREQRTSMEGHHHLHIWDDTAVTLIPHAAEEGLSGPHDPAEFAERLFAHERSAATRRRPAPSRIRSSGS